MASGDMSHKKNNSLELKQMTVVMSQDTVVSSLSAVVSSGLGSIIGHGKIMNAPAFYHPYLFGTLGWVGKKIMIFFIKEIKNNIFCQISGT